MSRMEKKVESVGMGMEIVMGIGKGMEVEM